MLLFELIAGGGDGATTMVGEIARRIELDRCPLDSFGLEAMTGLLIVVDVGVGLVAKTFDKRPRRVELGELI